MTDKQKYRLVHAEARRRASQSCLDAPDGWIVTVSPPTRNLEQNSLLWALLTDVSSQVDWYGQKLTQEEWKDVFSASLKKQKVIPGLDGEFVICGQSTSKMSKSEFSDLVEIINAFGASKNVRWSK